MRRDTYYFERYHHDYSYPVFDYDRHTKSTNRIFSFIFFIMLFCFNCLVASDFQKWELMFGFAFFIPEVFGLGIMFIIYALYIDRHNIYDWFLGYD